MLNALTSLAYIIVLALTSLGVIAFIDRWPRWLPGILFLLYGYFWILVSTLVLESDRYFITEQLRFSEQNGAFLLLLMYTVLFLCGYAITVLIVGGRLPPIDAVFPRLRLDTIEISASQVEALAFWGLVCILGLLIVHTIASGSPLLTPGVRPGGHFWQGTAIIPALAKLNAQVVPLVFAFSVTARSRRRIAALVALALISFVLLGDKFSYLLVVVYFASYRFLQRTRIRRLFTVRRVLLAFAALTIVIWLSVSEYRSVGRTSEGAAESFVFYRALVLQGHTWWGVVQYVSENGPLWNLWHLLENDGMDTVMRSIAPDSVYWTYREAGASFTGAYPAILHLSVGSWALLAQIPMGIAFGFVVLAFHRVARIGFFSAFFAAKVFQYFLAVLTMGYTSRLFSVSAAIMVSALVFVALVEQMGRQHRTMRRELTDFGAARRQV